LHCFADIDLSILSRVVGPSLISRAIQKKEAAEKERNLQHLLLKEVQSEQTAKWWTTASGRTSR